MEDNMGKENGKLGGPLYEQAVRESHGDSLRGILEAEKQEEKSGITRAALRERKNVMRQRRSGRGFPEPETFQPEGRSGSEEEQTRLEPSKRISRRKFVAATAVLIPLLLYQIREAANIDASSISKSGPTPAEVPTPEEAAEEMARFNQTIEKINREPGMVVSGATPKPTEIQREQREEETKIRVSVKTGDFTPEEAEFIHSKSVEILNTWEKIFGPPLRESGVVTIKRSDSNYSTDPNSIKMWCYENEIFYGRDSFPLEEFEPQANLVHEWVHILGGEWPATLQKLFDLLETERTVRSMQIVISHEIGLQYGNDNCDSDLLCRAQERDQNFFLNFRQIYEQQKCTPDSSREELLALAEQVSPGFSEWLDSLERGPQIQLPEPTGKKFIWDNLSPTGDSHKSIMWVYPVLVRHSIAWPGPWENSASGLSWRVGPNEFEGYVIVKRTVDLNLGPEGSLPFGTYDDIISGKTMGHWE